MENTTNVRDSDRKTTREQVAEVDNNLGASQGLVGGWIEEYMPYDDDTIEELSGMTCTLNMIHIMNTKMHMFSSLMTV